MEALVADADLEHLVVDDSIMGGISRRQKIAQGIEAFVFEVVLADKVIIRVLLLRSACVLVLR